MISDFPVTDRKLLILAREIAMDILPLQTILDSHEITQEQFNAYKNSAIFQNALSEQVMAWNSALNTHDRVKLKAAASIEGVLEELHGRMHDRSESLMAKAKVAELVAKLAGMAQPASSQASGTGFSVTINLGNSAQPIVIDSTPVGNALELEDYADE